VGFTSSGITEGPQRRWQKSDRSNIHILLTTWPFISATMGWENNMLQLKNKKSIHNFDSEIFRKEITEKVGG